MITMCCVCSRSIALCVRVLTEASAVMVVDHKGRILHATGKLSNLLGHPVAALVKMELNALIPQPICQMHGSWFKVKNMPLQPSARMLRILLAKRSLLQQEPLPASACSAHRLSLSSKIGDTSMRCSLVF